MLVAVFIVPAAIAVLALVRCARQTQTKVSRPSITHIELSQPAGAIGQTPRRCDCAITRLDDRACNRLMPPAEYLPEGEEPKSLYLYGRAAGLQPVGNG